MSDIYCLRRLRQLASRLNGRHGPSDSVQRVRYGGGGPALLLLHGHPRTRTTWHRVAPLLAEHYTVVCPDLRGRGESTKVPTTADHAPYVKRAMAGDLVALMRELGHDRFAVVGHDRGSYVVVAVAKPRNTKHPQVTLRRVMSGISQMGRRPRLEAVTR